MTGGKFANGAASAAFAWVVHSMSKDYYSRNQYPGESYDDFMRRTGDAYLVAYEDVSRYTAQNKNPLNTDEPKDNPTVTGSIDPLTGQVFGGVFGTSVSTGLIGDTLNPNACSVITACVQFGLGVFVGAGGSVGVGVSTESLHSGTSESFGIFGNIGAFGAAAGGSLNFGEGSIGGAKGFLGFGKGISGGVQFCQSSLSCFGN